MGFLSLIKGRFSGADLFPTSDIEAAGDDAVRIAALPAPNRARLDAEALIAAYRAERKQIEDEILTDEGKMLRVEDALADKRAEVEGKRTRLIEIDSVISVFEKVASGFESSQRPDAVAASDQSLGVSPAESDSEEISAFNPGGESRERQNPVIAPDGKPEAPSVDGARKGPSRTAARSRPKTKRATLISQPA